jgi:hypothetical protein
MRLGWSGGLVREIGDSSWSKQVVIQNSLNFSSPRNMYKGILRQEKNTLNNVFIIFYCLLSYKIDKYGEVVAEPI